MNVAFNESLAYTLASSDLGDLAYEGDIVTPCEFRKDLLDFPRTSRGI